MDEEQGKKIKVSAVVRRCEYYDIELVVPDYYTYDDIEGAVREKYMATCMDMSPADEYEEIINIDEEAYDEQGN